MLLCFNFAVGQSGGLYNRFKSEVDFLDVQISLLELEKSEVESRAFSANTWASIRRIGFDGRELLGNEFSSTDGQVLDVNTDDARFLYLSEVYRFDMTKPIPDILANRRFTYFLQCDWTNATQLPEAPLVGAENVDYLYYYQRSTSATSLGSTTISDVPTTWRNYTGIFRIVLERNELTAAQQLGIIDGIERELLAGMGASYTSASLTSRYVDFQQTTSGPNAVLLESDLLARGWIRINDNRVYKDFPDINGVPRRWGILYND